jgi:hypothetical protein
MKSRLQPLNLILLIFLVFISCKKEEQDGVSFKYENDQLLCENFHAVQVKMDGAFIFMHDKKDLYIFNKTDNNLKLIQTISFPVKAGNFCIAVQNGVLAIGRSEALGNGKVFIYRQVNDKWELNQTLEIARNHDNFGCSIDFDDNLLVIGADARLVSADDFANNTADGRVYVFRNNGTEWVQEAELVSKEPFGDNRFGQTVAVFGDYVIAGPMLEIFHYDGTWTSLRTQYDIKALQIYHDRGNFVIGDVNKSDNYKIFFLENDASFTSMNISGDPQFGLARNQVCMKDDLLAINFPYDRCRIYHFENNAWNMVAELGTSYDVDIITDAVEISYPYIILSGYITQSQESSIVYFYKQN